MNTRDTSNDCTNNYDGILSKIIKFIKNIFKKGNIKYISAGDSEVNNNKSDNSFFKSIKFEEDPEEKMLLKIQDDLEKMGINEENIYALTKDLTDSQKIKLENLYKEQIRDYEISINDYKNKIINVKKKLAETNQ